MCPRFPGRSVLGGWDNRWAYFGVNCVYFLTPGTLGRIDEDREEARVPGADDVRIWFVANVNRLSWLDVHRSASHQKNLRVRLATADQMRVQDDVEIVQ